MMLVVFGANVASCFGGHSSGDREAGAITPRSLNFEDSVEVKLASPLATVWARLGYDLDSLEIGIVDEPEIINAASFGEARFLLWQGLRLVTEEGQFAIAAHEIAHDRLHHSRKVGELRDVTDFIGEAIATVGQLGDGEERLQRWSANVVIPRYSRAQELAADSTAVEFLRRIDFPDPPGAMCRAFIQLKATAVVNADKPGFFSSHPALDERIARLRNFATGSSGLSC